MAKPFWTELSELKIEDDITVFWTDGMMYVTDESDGQASTNTSLFQAYKFAVLIQASIFDYEARDIEVKELTEQMLGLINEDFYKIDVWEYINNIKDDFKKFTNIELDIDDKRAIACFMTDVEQYDITCEFGSATYIARLLWNYIKGNNQIKNSNGEVLYKGCDNKIINKLADKYLQTDDYDIVKFAEELHKKAKETIRIEINGSLWINSAKYEYVDKIIVRHDDVDIYWKDKNIGCIARENIQTLVEQNYEENIMTDLIENLSYLFDITKVGDF